MPFAIAAVSPVENRLADPCRSSTGDAVAVSLPNRYRNALPAGQCDTAEGAFEWWPCKYRREQPDFINGMLIPVPSSFHDSSRVRYVVRKSRAASGRKR